MRRASDAHRVAEPVPRRDPGRARAARAHRCASVTTRAIRCARRLRTLAQHLPITYETAEEIVALRPDLVLTSRHSAIADAQCAAARRHSLRAVRRAELRRRQPRADPPDRRAARQPSAKAKRWSHASSARSRRRACRRATRRLTAAVYQTGGLTAGANTVTDELMQIVGLDNLAARYGIQTHRPLPLEAAGRGTAGSLLVGETSRGGRHARRAHRASSRAAGAAIAMRREFSGALHVLLRTDDDRSSRRARRAHATHATQLARSEAAR